MTRLMRIVIVVGLVVAVGVVVALKKNSQPQDNATSAMSVATAHGPVPRLLDLGSVSCIPCKMMKPILDELRTEYAGRLQVDFVDVWKDESAGKEHGIVAIPTQIFFDAAGNEAARHEGYIDKEAILAQFEAAGIDLSPQAASSPVTSTEFATPPPPATLPTGPTVSATYPGLASGVMSFAVLDDLPADVIAQCGDLRWTEKNLAEALDAAADKTVVARMGFFLLEQIAAKPLLLDAARKQTTGGKSSDAAILGAYQLQIVRTVNVTDDDIARFYDDNKEMMDGATLEQVKDQLYRYVLQQKQQEAIEQHVKTLGQRLPIRVSRTWVATQDAIARDNPVDKSRQGGKPLLVDFGADGCRPCDMMTPILNALRTKYASKADVLFVHVRENPALAARYGVQSIPTQVFFDKEGAEVFRHTGFYPQEQIENRLQQMGVQ